MKRPKFNPNESSILAGLLAFSSRPRSRQMAAHYSITGRCGCNSRSCHTRREQSVKPAPKSEVSDECLLSIMHTTIAVLYEERVPRADMRKSAAMLLDEIDRRYRSSRDTQPYSRELMAIAASILTAGQRPDEASITETVDATEEVLGQLGRASSNVLQFHRHATA
jgi:hypothetical protein